MRTLITGGTGFIGSRLAAQCLEAGDSVTVLGQTRTSVEQQTASALRERGAQLAIVSVTDRDALAPWHQGIDVVFHLAAAQHEANVPDRHFHEVNVEGTRNVLEASRAAGVQRFVHGSSIGVYGWQPGETVSEASPLAPDNVYGASKLAGEELVGSFEGLASVIVRIAEAYGPGDRRLLKLFSGVRSRTLVGIGGMQNLHHMVYVDDLVRGLRLASQATAAVGRTFVLAGPKPVSSAAVVEAIARALERRPPRLRVPLRPLLLVAGLLEGLLRPLGVQPPLHRRRMDYFRKSFSFACEDARDLLGFSAEVGLDEGIAETARWYAEQGLL